MHNYVNVTDYFSGVGTFTEIRLLSHDLATQILAANVLSQILANIRI